MNNDATSEKAVAKGIPAAQTKLNNCENETQGTSYENVNGSSGESR